MPIDSVAAHSAAMQARRLPLEKLKSKSALRSCLIRERGDRCERCKITEWCGEPITIEMDHIDGNKKNHAEENLRLLCPNCHSQTLTWRNKKRAGVEELGRLSGFRSRRLVREGSNPSPGTNKGL